MNNWGYRALNLSKTLQPDQTCQFQNILIFQQNGSGKNKIEGIRRYSKNLFTLEIVSINAPLPPVIDDTTRYLSCNIQADLVLDFLVHPDLSYDLAVICKNRKIPMVASGKKFKVKGAMTPVT